MAKEYASSPVEQAGIQALNTYPFGNVFTKSGRILCLSMAKNPLLFFLSAIVIGFGNGVIFPTFQSMVNNLADSVHRGAANSTLYTAVDLGMGLGMIMAGLIAEHISLSFIFWVNAAVGAAGLLFFRLFVLKAYESRYKQ